MNPGRNTSLRLLWQLLRKEVFKELIRSYTRCLSIAYKRSIEDTHEIEIELAETAPNLLIEFLSIRHGP